MTDQLRDRIAAAIEADCRKAIPPTPDPFGGPPVGGWGRSQYDIADAVLAEVQPDLGRHAAENGRLRAAWTSARRRARENHLYGSGTPGGAIREALVMAGYITRRDTVASAVAKLDKAPRSWYVRWLVNNLTRLGKANTALIREAKRQAARADGAEQREADLARQLITRTAELRAARASAFREAARVLEDTGRDDDAVNLLDIIADGITTHATSACGCVTATHPGHYPSCPTRTAKES